MSSTSDFEPQGNETSGGEPENQAEMSQESYAGAMRSLTAGQIIRGIVVQLDDAGALVDVGTKSEGVIPPHEMGDRFTEDGKPLAVGESIDVYVLKPEDEEGAAVLSKKRADYEAVWRKILKAQEDGQILSAMVTERVRGGLVVDLGVRAFLPASHVNVRNVAGLENLVGRTVKLKIMEVDRDRKRVVVSQKEALTEIRGKRREATMSSLKEGQIRKGTVRRITDYGAFVDLGGVDGLLHVTEMSWTYISHPSEAVKQGERLEVMVLKIDNERNRISLGLKQILPDPWEELPRKYAVGDNVTGKITRVVAAGAFFRMPEGVEGIIPSSELSMNRRAKPEDKGLEGKEVEARIIAIRPTERRITFSLRSMHVERERKEMRSYMDSQESGRVTIGDILGASAAKDLTKAMAQNDSPEPDDATSEQPAPSAEKRENDEGVEAAAEAMEATAPTEEAQTEAAAAEVGEIPDPTETPVLFDADIEATTEEPCESSVSPEESEPEKTSSPDSSENTEQQ